jgi:hypothetical protein
MPAVKFNKKTAAATPVLTTTLRSFAHSSQPSQPYVDRVTFQSISATGEVTTSQTLQHATTPYGPADDASYDFVTAPSALVSDDNDFNAYDTLEPPDDEPPFAPNQPREEPEGGKGQSKREHQVCNRLSVQSTALMRIIQSES